MNYQRKSIGRENAKTLAATEWWENQPSYELVAIVGLTIEELTLPIKPLQYAVEQSLRISVSVQHLTDNVDAILRTLRQKFEVTATPDQVVALVWPILKSKVL